MKFAVGDRVKIINDNEDMWARRGASGVITEIGGAIRVLFDRGDYDTGSGGGPYSWLVHKANIEKTYIVKKIYKLTVENKCLCDSRAVARP